MSRKKPQVCSTRGMPNHIHSKCSRTKCSACHETGHSFLKCPNSLWSPCGEEVSLTNRSEQYSDTLSHSGDWAGRHATHLLRPLQITRLTQPKKLTRGGQSAHSTQQRKSLCGDKTDHQQLPQKDLGRSAFFSLPAITRQTDKQPSATKPPPKSTEEAATNYWLQCVRAWYPSLLSQSYFLPPLHFNRVQYDVQNIAGQKVLVPTQCNRKCCNSIPTGHYRQDNPRPLPSRMWSDHAVPPGHPLPRIQDTDVTDDRAVQQVLQNIRKLARNEVMMVVSQLDFKNYLNNDDHRTSAGALRVLQRPAKLGICFGNFDLLIISLRYGLIVGEIKSFGADPKFNKDQALVTKVQKAVKQLNKADGVLRQLVKDLVDVKVTKILMLPNVTSTQLQQALGTHPQVEQDLCQCVGAPDTAAAVARCLCADSLKTSVWWERAVKGHGPDKSITDEIYEIFVARFCGPATTVEVPTVTTPRRFLQLRTLTEAIAHTGLRMAVLTLYPEQVDLLNRPGLPRVFLWGPPGTGKTVVLTLKALQWRQEENDVHLLSLNKDSRAVVMLIECQLQHSLTTPFTTTAAATSRVRRHTYDFQSDGDVDDAVSDLSQYAKDGELYVIVDEAYPACALKNDGTGGLFAEFVRRLYERFPKLHLWAASVRHNTIPACLEQERLTTPIRCPPVVCREVEQSTIIDDRYVPKYSSSAVPAPTDGPEVRTLQHSKRRGHASDAPENCERCGDSIADLINDVLPGQAGQDLQYRDTIILCDKPHDGLAVVKRLGARSLPVKVVTSSHSEATINDLALAKHNDVIVTHYSAVTGLERRVVVVMQNDDVSRLYAMSRSTSLLVLVD